MKKLLLLVSIMALWPISIAMAAEALFTWTPNTETTLAGYKIYYGTAAGNYTKSVDQGMARIVDGKAQGSVPGLTEGTPYYFVCVAYDADGYESGPSNEVVWTAHERLQDPVEFYAAPGKKIIISVE